MRIRDTARVLRGAVRNLSSEDWASIHFKLALGVFWPIAFSATEGGLASNLGPVFVGTWMTLTAIGTVISITGMMMTAQAGMTRLRGFRVELCGLWVFMSGPLTYLAAQIGYMAADPSIARIAQIFLADALCGAVGMRILKVHSTATRALRPSCVRR